MTAVGVCLGEQGAVVAVVGGDPPRLAGIACLTGPTTRQLLVRARRRLGLPRWSAVSVVVEPDPAGPAGLLPRDAIRLARSGLVPASVTTPDRAAAVRSTVELEIDPRLVPAVSGRAAELAVGAALATRSPEPAPAPAAPTGGRAGFGGDAGGGAPRRGIDPQELGGATPGWAVQRTGEPPVRARTNPGHQS